MKSVIEIPLRTAASQLERLFLALLPLWVVHRKVSGNGEPIALAELLKVTKEERISLDIVSAAADMLGEVISLAQELEISWRAVLAKRKCLEADAVAYALAKVAFDLREHLLAGLVLVMPNSEKRLGKDARGKDRYGSAFLMAAAGFSTTVRPGRSTARARSSEYYEYYEQTVGTQNLRVRKDGISEPLRDAALALRDRWTQSANIGYHVEKVGDRDTAIIMVWAKAWQRNQSERETLTSQAWLLALRTAVRVVLDEEPPSESKNAVNSDYVAELKRRILLILDAQKILFRRE